MAWWSRRRNAAGDARTGRSCTIGRSRRAKDRIVDADDPEAPAWVKVYAPHNLGVSCGDCDNPPLPGWVMSGIAPVDLPSTRILPRSRRHWWQRLFHSAG